MQKVPLSPGRIRVLGVDPAAAGPTGYGIIESDGRHCRMLKYGALQVARERKTQSPEAALFAVHELICRLINEFSPSVLALESVFAALNLKTALRLAEVRGVVLLAAAQHGIEVHSYAPREVKASVAGYGHADKHQIQLMVRAILALAETPEPPDAADALAVALCHLQSERIRERFGISSARASLARPAPANGEARSATFSRVPRVSSLR